jgi:hypothetical protein
MNILKMTLKFWGSGMTALIVLVLSMLPMSLIDQENKPLVILGYFLLGFVAAPIIGGAAQYWFWRDHDWLGVLK